MRSDVVPSPNIWHWPEIYEVENRAQDVDNAIWTLIDQRVPFAGRDVLDLGCGDGFHLPRFAGSAASVVGVEPHPPLIARARTRTSTVDRVRVLSGCAQKIPIEDGSVDVVHARTAYFFGRGCEPGLYEVDRVLRPGGMLVIVDLDGHCAPYGKWLCADTRRYRPTDIEAFFAEQDFDSVSVATRWVFPDRATLESVLRIEFSRSTARRAIAEVTGNEIPVGYRVRFRTKPTGIVI